MLLVSDKNNNNNCYNSIFQNNNYNKDLKSKPKKWDTDVSGS